MKIEDFPTYLKTINGRIRLFFDIVSFDDKSNRLYITAIVSKNKAVPCNYIDLDNRNNLLSSTPEWIAEEISEKIFNQKLGL